MLYKIFTLNTKIKTTIITICALLDWPPESPDNQYHLNK